LSIRNAIDTLESEGILSGSKYNDAIPVDRFDEVATEILISNLNFRDIQHDLSLKIPASSAYLEIAVNDDIQVADKSSADKENIIVTTRETNEQLTALDVSKMIGAMKPRQSQLSEPIFLRKGVNDKESSGHDVIKQLLYT